VDTGRFAGRKRSRKLQAVMVIASMKAITVEWLSSSKFGSARLASQTALITAEFEHGVDYRGSTDLPT